MEFKQANLANVTSVEKAFHCEGGETFDLVFNLAAETKYSQSEEVGGVCVGELFALCGIG